MVTEITYHKDANIAADVYFLSLDQWRDEVSLCIQDATPQDDDELNSELREEMTGPLKPSSPAGIAWQKVSGLDAYLG